MVVIFPHAQLSIVPLAIEGFFKIGTENMFNKNLNAQLGFNPRMLEVAHICDNTSFW